MPQKNTIKRKVPNWKMILVGVIFALGLIVLFGETFSKMNLELKTLEKVSGLGWITRTRDKAIQKGKNSTPVHKQAKVGGGGPSNSGGPKDLEKEWFLFSEKFGKHLNPEYSPNGLLVAVTDSPGSQAAQKPGVPTFQPTNSKEVLSRANEIVASAESLLGLNPSYPLSYPKLNQSSLSAQVFYTQSYQGIPILPGGMVRIDLGRQGQLLALDSSYVSSIAIENGSKMTIEEARQEAISAVGNPNSSAVFSERPIVWVNGRKGYYAYEFLVAGRQVVIDAASGEVLRKQDHRNYHRNLAEVSKQAS